MEPKRTLMAVHAHPDDEATSTGGVLAKYSDLGYTTVVVTCTNGELGDLPGGIKPDHDDHDQALVVEMRLAELERACAILGVSRVETLGFRDSGMVDWEHKAHPDAFCNVPLEDAAARIIDLMEFYKPDVIVSYDEQSPYNHPDHVQASRATSLAVAKTDIAKKHYLTAMRGNRFQRVREMLEEQGVEMPPPPPRSDEWVQKMLELEGRITTVIDVSDFAVRKIEALRTHVSQIQDSFWSQLPAEALAEIFGEESFILMGAPPHEGPFETDLFEGL